MGAGGEGGKSGFGCNGLAQQRLPPPPAACSGWAAPHAAAPTHLPCFSSPSPPLCQIPHNPIGVLFMAHGCVHDAADFWPPSSACPECSGARRCGQQLGQQPQWAVAARPAASCCRAPLPRAPAAACNLPPTTPPPLSRLFRIPRPLCPPRPQACPRRWPTRSRRWRGGTPCWPSTQKTGISTTAASGWWVLPLLRL